MDGEEQAYGSEGRWFAALSARDAHPLGPTVQPFSAGAVTSPRNAPTRYSDPVTRSHAPACRASSAPRRNARCGSGSASAAIPNDAAIACNSAAGRPPYRGRNVGADNRRRSPSEFFQEPRCVLVGASATTATQGPAYLGSRARSLSTAAMLNGTCAPSSTTGRGRVAPSRIVTLHPPDETGARAGFWVEQRRVERRSGAGADALAAERVENGAGERGVGRLDRRVRVELRAHDHAAERVGARLRPPGRPRHPRQATSRRRRPA